MHALPELIPLGRLQDNAQCTLGDGSFTCACNPGFSGDGRYCFDINECETKTSDDEDTCGVSGVQREYAVLPPYRPHPMVC